MRFKISYNWYRFMGITGLFLIGYIVIIGIFGNVDITPILPMQLATSIETHWPNLPFFNVQKEPVDDGKDQETYYTVPTRQLTPQEIAKLKATGPEPAAAAKPKETTAPSAAR
jgi:hypothetical protein